jgi:hypothetical protein
MISKKALRILFLFSATITASEQSALSMLESTRFSKAQFTPDTPLQHTFSWSSNYPSKSPLIVIQYRDKVLSLCLIRYPISVDQLTLVFQQKHEFNSAQLAVSLDEFYLREEFAVWILNVLKVALTV